MLALRPLIRIPELGAPGKYARDLQLADLIPSPVPPISRCFQQFHPKTRQEIVFPISKAVIETSIQNSQLLSPSSYDNNREHG